MNPVYLAQVKRATRRAGQKQLVHYLEGKRLTQRQAIAAKCYDCNGLGEQGTCDIEICPLLPYSPYRTKEKKNATA